jgi:hypothetical protein
MPEALSAPWQVYRAERPPERLFVHGPQGQSIAMVFEDRGVPGFDNARLIAKAPELRDAVAALLAAKDKTEFDQAVDKAALLLVWLAKNHG